MTGMSLCGGMPFLLIILCLLGSRCEAFGILQKTRFSRSTSLRSTMTPKIMTSEVTPALLKSLQLFDQYGEKKELGLLMGDDKSVVVFLRHLGWPYCWAYAEAWCDQIPQMRTANIAGPVFISIGEGDNMFAIGKSPSFCFILIQYFTLYRRSTEDISGE